ncbi:MAG: NAD(P)/FAD-dependent oxidoreductase [Spartobacteria bacterium]|nr:NAD(P)/FAD-dependent oxidoreductase [Spartobacteria bacterium]
MEFDFVVVGGGSAGYAGARTAVDLGLRTAVIEGGSEVGGLCILRGCMPSKTLLESARRFRVLQRAGEFGLALDHPRFDVGAIIERKKRLVGEFADYRKGQLEAGRFDFIRGEAVFLSPNEVSVNQLDGTEQIIRSKVFLLATGSKIAVPPVPGLAEAGCLTSDDMLDRTEMPDSLIVLGGGPVALELASYCRAFGCRVTLIPLEVALRDDGIEIHTGTRLIRVEKNDQVRRVVFEKGGREMAVEASHILNALGRTPQLAGTEELGLELRGGRIDADIHQRTSVANIFAAGDVCGPCEVVHVAIQQGEAAAANAASFLGVRSGPLKFMDYRLKLFAVFSEPQLACVGATEAELHADGTPHVTATYPFNDHGKSLVMGETAGFVKITASKETGEILGAAVVGPDAAELIHEVTVAMHYHATAQDFATIPHYHPTLSEIWTYPAEEIASQITLGS